MLKRFDEAMADYDRALALRPDYAEAHTNLGVTLHALKRFDDALQSHERALAVRPDFAEAHYNEGLCRLLIGDFDRGWAEHEWWRETEQLQARQAEFRAAAMDRIAGDRRQDYSASCRARLWRHHSVLPLRTAGRSVGRARDPRGARGAARFDTTQSRWRGAGGGERRHRAAVRYALPFPQPAVGVRHSARDDTARNALSARIRASGGELGRAAAAKNASAHRLGLVRPAGAQQRSKSLDRSRLVFVAAGGDRRDARQPATRGSRCGCSRFASNGATLFISAKS